MSNDSAVTELRLGTIEATSKDAEVTTSATPPPNPASPTQPAAGPTRNATHRNKPRSTATALLSLAGVLVATSYIGSLIVLSGAAVPPHGPSSSVGPDALGAMIAMYSVVAAFVLTFTAIIRHTDKN